MPSPRSTWISNISRKAPKPCHPQPDEDGVAHDAEGKDGLDGGEVGASLLGAFDAEGLADGFGVVFDGLDALHQIAHLLVAGEAWHNWHFLGKLAAVVQ